ncbi:MAG: glycerol-3-phosphate 1-O-acyltransferase PlsY [Phycisphaerae bacterium]
MITHPALLLIVFPVLAYVIGSTSFGAIIARLKGINLREHGSGNIGATNVGRVLGRKWGILCFFLDATKGFAPTLAVVQLTHGAGTPEPMIQVAWLLTGSSAILGHVFSFWLKGKGGKGVATSLGVVLGVFPYFTLPGLIAFGLWILVVLVTRYVSLASVLAALSFLPAFFALHWPGLDYWPMVSFAAAMMLLIIVRHRSNIRRLLNGTESKIGAGKKQEPEDVSPTGEPQHANQPSGG